MLSLLFRRRAIQTHPMTFMSIVGARPQFIKAGPLSTELRKEHREILVHTGQHYDYEMSAVFFKDLELPRPDFHLEIGSGSHAAQTAAMLRATEEIMTQQKPAAVIVYGDTNSTMAGALAAAKLNIPVAHVEAGLRSFNRTMPEEINRIVVDHVSHWLFAPSTVAQMQLSKEGLEEGVHVVGDIMLDMLQLNAGRAGASTVLKRLNLRDKGYYLVTIHRAQNTDQMERLAQIIAALGRLDSEVVFPVHPRTKNKLMDFDISTPSNIRLIEPQGFLDMLRLEKGALCILTDSGGVQKEAYYLGIPCVTLREETEWVETTTSGWNVLVGTDPKKIVEAAQRHSPGVLPQPDFYGRGRTAVTVAEILRKSN